MVDIENFKYCPVSPGFSSSLISHFLSISILYIAVEVSMFIYRVVPGYRWIHKFLDMVTGFALLLFTSTMAAFFYYFVGDYFEITEECEVSNPGSHFIAGFMFSFYGLFVIAAIIVGIGSVVQVYQIARREENLNKGLDRILKNIYFDKAQI